MTDVETPEDGNEPAWRQRAVSRSLNAARSRAEQRVQRFLDAAFELIDEKGTTEFTIQEVIDRSKQSLRGFYQYFDGKDELLLALFEETIREATDDLRSVVESETDPLERLRAFTIRLHEWCDPSEKPRKRGTHNRRPIMEFSVQLAVDHPERVKAAMAPVSRMMLELVEAADAAGAIDVHRHAARRRAHAADGDVQLVRQPARRERAHAPHRRGDLGVLPPRPRRRPLTRVLRLHAVEVEHADRVAAQAPCSAASSVSDAVIALDLFARERPRRVGVRVVGLEADVVLADRVDRRDAVTRRS